MSQPILSRHRLPRNYRLGLTALWLTPVALLAVTLVLRHGPDGGIFDVRLLIPLIVMCIPALYVWQEGIDVLPTGIVRRVHLPRYYRYDQLDTWYFDPRTERRTLTVWNASQHKVVECRAGHLSDLPVLLKALNEHVRPRRWPY